LEVDTGEDDSRKQRKVTDKQNQVRKQQSIRPKILVLSGLFSLPYSHQTALGSSSFIPCRCGWSTAIDFTILGAAQDEFQFVKISRFIE
jgi:hypothetical protein